MGYLIRLVTLIFYSLLARAARYFLITPKLLPDLVYNDAMRVSCVFNGENQPGELSLAAALDKHRRYLSAASAFHERGGGGRENVGEVVVA